MTPTTPYLPIKLIEPRLHDCVKANELLDSAENLDEGPSYFTDRLRAPLIAIEKSLVGILVLLLSRSHHLRHPFSDTTLEESCLKATVGGCANVLATIIYNLNLAAANRSPVACTWDDLQRLLVVYQMALLELTGMLSPAKTGPSASSFLKNIRENNSQASKLKRIVGDHQKEEKDARAGHRGQNDRSADVPPETHAPKEAQTEGTKAKTKHVATQTSRQRTHADGLTGSAPTQSHDDCTGYTRGLSEGRSGVCHTLKRLDLFEDEAPRGKRASWLLKAIDKDGMKESTETVELLLELGADPNRLSSKVDSQVATYLPLCYAAKKGYAAIVELLLKKDADIHAPDSSGDTVLLCAARYGRNQLVELLLNEPYRANIEEQTAGATDRKGYTPLMMAVHSGRIETVKLLLDKEAKGEVVDDAGTPLLHIAIAKGGLEVTRLLVEKGGVQMATVDARFVNTALHCAIRSGSIEVGKYLIDKAPALIHAQNYKRETPLSLAARKKTLGLIEPLVKKGARMDAKDELGRTPLHVAVLAKDMEMVRTLVRVGAKLETPDSSGRTPLHSAVMEKDVASVKTLFELGSKTDCSDNRGRTPLHEAVIGEDLESVKTLLTLRCNMVVKDRAGKYPLQYVLEMPKSKEASALELLREFLRAHERNTPFHDKFHALIKATRDGRLAFVHEIRTNDPGLVTWRPHADSAFQLPLHEAIKADKKEVLEELCMAVKGSSAIDTKDHRGNTALHQSILSNQHKMIRLLIGNGANKELISGEADGSLPPLHLAAREMNLKAVEVLLSMGAKAKRRISGGEICDKCKEMKTRPEGRNARCILRNLDPSVRSNHNFKLIDKALITAIKA